MFVVQSENVREVAVNVTSKDLGEYKSACISCGIDEGSVTGECARGKLASIYTDGIDEIESAALQKGIVEDDDSGGGNPGRLIRKGPNWNEI